MTDAEIAKRRAALAAQASRDGYLDNDHLSLVDEMFASHEALSARTAAILELTDDDSWDDAIAQLRFDAKKWAEACEAIKTAESWPPNAYPSMQDRRVFAALLDRAKQAEARVQELERKLDFYGPESPPCDDGCELCSGEYCNIHGTEPCDCDVIDRHGAPDAALASPPATPGETT